MKWPSYTQEEIKKVTEVIKSGKVNYWTGNEVKNFEKEFSRFIGNKYSIAVCNATLALEASLLALNIGQGDEVITTPRSYNASASCILRVGAKPVFADIDIETQNISVKDIEKKISNKTKAIICVHLGGTPCEIIEIKKVAKKNGIKLIEDCSQAHGAKYKNKYVGTFSDIAVWSFCNDKIISTIVEGGMISTKNKKLFFKLWSLKEIGKDFKKSNTSFLPKFKWTHDYIGANLRMTEVQAAVGRIQLKNLNRIIKVRRNLAKIMIKFLDKNKLFFTFKLDKKYFSSFYRLYFFLDKKKLNKKISREKIIKSLRGDGNDVSVGSCPEIYLEKPFKKILGKKIILPNAQYLSEISLAYSFSHLTSKKEIYQFLNSIKKISKGLK